jgi:hypothetical protein
MKIVAVIIGLAVVALIVWLILPYAVPQNGRGASSSTSRPSATDPSRSTEAPRPDKRLEAPLSPEEQRREEMSEKRLPFYRYLRQNYSQAIERFAVTENLDTLDLVVTREDDATLNGLVREAISPQAREYGFRRVRFYVRAAPGSVDPYRLVAESSYDETGRWITFRK